MFAPGAEPAKGPFTADELQALEQAGIFKGKAFGGKRKVSARLLVPSDSDSYGSMSSSSSSASSASLRLRGFINPSSAKNFELPTDQESVAALEYMGFAQATAQEIYQRWESRPDPEQNPYSFLEYAAGQFENRNQGDLSHSDFMTVSPKLEAHFVFRKFWRQSLTRSTIESRVEQGVPGCHSGPAIR